MTTIKDENGNALIGYLTIGGVALPRAELTRTLPDIERFERCLADAEMVNEHMTEHGKPPAVFFGWSGAYVSEVADTMREVGAIQQAAAAQLHGDVTE